jgi:hypothetical protein
MSYGQQFDKTVRVRSHPTDVATSTTAAIATAADTTRIAVMFQNKDASITIYLGNSDVASNKGIALAAGQTYVDDRSSDAWYARSASGTPALGVTVFS